MFYFDWGGGGFKSIRNPKSSIWRRLLLSENNCRGYNSDQWRMMKCSLLCRNSFSPAQLDHGSAHTVSTVPEYIRVQCIIVVAELLSQH